MKILMKVNLIINNYKPLKTINMYNYKEEKTVQLNVIETIHFDKHENNINIGYQINFETHWITIDLNAYLELTKKNLRNKAKKILIKKINNL